MWFVVLKFFLRKHPLMTSAKFSDFFHSPPPRLHLELIYALKFTLPPLLHLPFYHIWKPPNSDIFFQVSTEIDIIAVCQCITHFPLATPTGTASNSTPSWMSSRASAKRPWPTRWPSPSLGLRTRARTRPGKISSNHLLFVVSLVLIFRNGQPVTLEWSSDEIPDGYVHVKK